MPSEENPPVNHHHVDGALRIGGLCMLADGACLTLELDSPICDFGGQSVSEIQLTPQPMTEAEEKKLRAFLGKRVTLSGSASEAATVHDHRPIKVSVETIGAL